MTTEKTQAEKLAQEVVALLEPACERIEIAGSIRRRQPDVGDIEIVGQPRLKAVPGLFSAADGGYVDLLDRACGALRGLLGKRPDGEGRHAWGPRYKRATYKGFALDLFAVLPPAQWGVIFTIRTGPADFSHQLVTPRGHRFIAMRGPMREGLMPTDYHVRNGTVLDGEGGVLDVPEEEDLFRLWGIEWIPPEERR